MTSAVDPPDLSQSPQLTLESWESAHDGSGHITLAWGCFSAKMTEWSADATELAQGKLADIASGTTAKMRGSAAPMHVTQNQNDGLDRLLACDDEGACSARTMVLFTDAHVHGCFVACANHECESAVASAHASSSTAAPPSPGIALRSLAFVVHHPHGALSLVSLLVLTCAALAIVTRPGRRRR